MQPLIFRKNVSLRSPDDERPLSLLNAGENMNLRAIATPLTIIAFIVVGLTGLCMFFGFRGGFVGQLHEWSSILFVAGSLLHIAVNWKPTLNHLRKPLVAGFAVCVLIATILATLPTGGQASGRKGLTGKVMNVVLDSNLGAVSAMTRQPEAALRSRLAQAGCGTMDPEASIRDIARTNHKNPMELVAVVLDKNPE